MFKRISHTFLFVLDQDQALDFYVGKLGMKVVNDADLGVMRFLTVGFPQQPDLVVVLMRPGEPAHDPQTTAEIRELVAKGAAGGGLILETDDCQGTYERLKAAGVEFTQEPVKRFYGTDCAVRDPFGNPIRFTQFPEGEIKVPTPEEYAAGTQ
ncbi:MAG: VOC family protein [Solirubrobacterales bacterium]|nr:VOC family protein [Solirubrobacterales bacterium]